MIVEDKVIWHDGLFLLPQHFQQQEKFLAALSLLPLQLHSFAWGFQEIVLDAHALLQGRVVLRAASGIFPDGTPFCFPQGQSAPKPINMPASQQNFTVYLGLPNTEEDFQGNNDINDAESYCRYRQIERDAVSTVSGKEQTVALQAASLSVHLFVDANEVTGECRHLSQVADKRDFSAIPIAFIKETDANGLAVKDEAFWPPLINIRTFAPLRAVLEEVLGLLAQRRQTLMTAFDQAQASSGMIEGLRLMVINRYFPVINHLSKLPMCHPERFYEVLAQLACELSSLEAESADQGPDVLQLSYVHTQLYDCFTVLRRLIHQGLTRLVAPTAQEIPLKNIQTGVFHAEVLDRTCFNIDVAKGSWVLAVKASMPVSELKMTLSDVIRISAIEKMGELLKGGVSGIVLNELPVAPKELQYHQGYVYFQLEPHSLFWPDQQSSGFAFRLFNTINDLSMLFWYIRG